MKLSRLLTALVLAATAASSFAATQTEKGSLPSLVGQGFYSIDFGHFGAPSVLSSFLIDKTFSEEVSFQNVTFHDGKNTFALTSDSDGDIFALTPVSVAAGEWILSFNYYNDTGAAAPFKATIAYAPNAVVTSVPEPESYAMLLAGLGALGFAGRRRTK